MKEALKKFIYEKVKQATTPERPYYFIRGTGLRELCQSYGIDILELIDEMTKEGLVKKALINNKLAIYIYRPINRKKLETIQKEFEQFLKG